MLEPIVKTIEVPCSPEQAFSLFVDDMATWWPLARNSVSAMNGEVAKSTVIEPRSGGKVYEIGHDDTVHHWGTVTHYDPYNAFSMDWHIGMSPDSPSEVLVKFTDIGNGKTRVELTHRKWEAFGEKAADMRNGYNQGWVGVFEEAFFNTCVNAATPAA